MTTKVRLSKVAPWNPALRNSYRERWTEVNGRYFHVEAESLHSAWWVEEIDANGEVLWEPPTVGTRVGTIAFCESAFTLAEARQLIAEATR